LASKANVAKNTVHLFEAGLRQPTPNNLAALWWALEVEGIKLLFDESGVAIRRKWGCCRDRSPRRTHPRVRSWE
jgi:hypothetical protein